MRATSTRMRLVAAAVAATAAFASSGPTATAGAAPASIALPSGVTTAIQAVTNTIPPSGDDKVQAAAQVLADKVGVLANKVAALRAQVAQLKAQAQARNDALASVASSIASTVDHIDLGFNGSSIYSSGTVVGLKSNVSLLHNLFLGTYLYNTTLRDALWKVYDKCLRQVDC